LGVALVGVRVELAGELPVRLLDLGLGGVLGDAEDLVVVLLDEVLRAHPRRPSFRVSFVTSALLRATGLLVVLRLGLLLLRLLGRLRARLGLGDGHPRGADGALADAIPGLQDRHARRLGDVRGVGVNPCIVDRLVGGRALLAGQLLAHLRERAHQLLGDVLAPADQPAVAPRATDVVDHGQQFAEDVGDRRLLHGAPVPLHAATVVLVLGLEALEVGGALVERGPRLVQLGHQGRVLTRVPDLGRPLLGGGSGGGRRLGVVGRGGNVGLLRLLLLVEARSLFRHAAPSLRSSSTISASTTSSSALASPASGPAPAEAPAACAPWASAYMAWPSFWETAATFSVAVRISAVSSPLSFSFSSATADSTSVLISPGTLS